MRKLTKLAVTLLISVVILSVLSATVFAGSVSKVTYDQNAKKFIFTTGSKANPTDLFEAFKDVMPGDKLYQYITVDNTIDEETTVKIYLRSTGAEQGSEEFLSKLNLKVEQEGATTALFEAAADQKAGLADWVCLGTLKAGGKADLKLTLTVPEDLDTKFQNTVGTLDWQFKVEENPIPKPAPVTGVDTTAVVWIAISLAVLLGFAAFAIVSSKKKNSDKQ